MSIRLAAAAVLLLVTTCCADTELLQYPNLVPVTVHVAGHVGPVTVLFSAPDGRVFEVVEVDAPATLVREVPPSSAVSTRFVGGDAMDYAVLSIADLDEGDEVTLSLRPWIRCLQWGQIAPIESPEPVLVQVDTGCGGQRGWSDAPARLTVAYVEDPLHIGLALLDEAERPVRVATLTVPLADAHAIVPPSVDQFVTSPRRVPVTVTGAHVQDGAAFINLRGAIGEERIGLLWDVVPIDLAATSVAEVEMYPFAYEGLVSNFVREGDGDALVVREILEPDAPVADVSSRLPALTAVDAVVDSVTWQTSGALDAVDFVLLDYGRTNEIEVTPPSAVLRWFVVRRPGEGGEWTMPELPDALAAWRLDAGRIDATVGLYDVDGLSAAEARRDPFPHIYPDLSAGDARHAYVERTFWE